VNAIGDLWHQRFSESDTPVSILIIDEGPVGIPTGVGGIVVRAVVVDGPIHELKMAVTSGRVCIEEIADPQFSKIDFNPFLGFFLSKRYEIALRGNLLTAQTASLIT